MDRLRRAKQLSIVIALTAGAAGCAFSKDKDEVDLTGTKSFTLINTNVLQAKCMSCHSTAAAPGSGGGNDLSSYAKVIASGTITASNGAASSLWTETNSGSMPKNGSKIPASHIQAIYDWIQDGAQDN